MVTKFHFLFILMILISSCSNEKTSKYTPKDKVSNIPAAPRLTTKKYNISYEVDGTIVNDIIELDEPTSKELLEYLKFYKNNLPHPVFDTIYNAKGLPAVVKMNNDVMGAAIQQFTYNELDQLSSITGFDVKGNIKPYGTNIAIKTFTYDQAGNIIEQRYYNDADKLVSSAYENPPIIRKKYNDNNQLIETRFLNEKGEPMSSSSTLIYSYDSLGNLVSKDWVESY